MEVLIVRVVGGDAYFKLGIISLVNNQWSGGNKKVHIVAEDVEQFHLSFDFFEEIVVIHSTYITGACHSTDLKTMRWGDIYIPFNCRRCTLTEIEAKLSKILAISNWKMPKKLDFSSLIVHNDLKSYQQLSPSEFTIMTFIGQGIDCYSISKEMDRSLKTVRAHYRSACRKLGFNNQADFFRFAKYISKYGRDIANTLCL